MLTLEELRGDVESGAIDTVVCAFTDMQGRLLGKREHASFFLSESVDHGLEGCNYLLGLDMEMDPQPGYAMASWERGYGDFHLLPDLATLRRIPWLEGTALVLCDVAWEDGAPVVASPRQVLRAQVERARAAGLEAMVGSELEFYLLKESYADAHANHFRNLTPSVPYILDYHVLATTYDEGLIRQIRNGMVGAGIPVESSKGEAWPGQHEINFRYAAGSWAPTTLAWGRDNRTCGFRIVGHGSAKRVETRIPGGDVNPYLAFAALLAAGLNGIEQKLELPPALEGNAYESDAERFPSTLREAIAALEQGHVARAAFGDEVVDHYLNYGHTEQRLFDQVVTCWERERLFERG